jgi:hypothetical protein
LKLLPSIASALLVALLASKAVAFVGADWIFILSALVLAYGAFSAIAFVVGLDADDCLIANAVWTRVRGAFGQ